MKVNLVLSAVSAAAAVTAFSLWNGKALCILAVYLSFLFIMKGPASLFIQLCVMSVFGMIYVFQADMNVTHLKREQPHFNIVFTNVPEVDGNSMQTIAQTDSGEKLLLKKKFDDLEDKRHFEDNYLAGMECRITGILKKPDSSRNPNSFNYQKYLHNRKIHWILKVQKLESCKIEHQNNFIYKLINIRYKGLKLIKKQFSEESRGIASALLFGEAGFIHEEMLRSYQVLGIVHLLSISGLHVTILAGGIFLLGIRCGFTRKKMQGILLVILPLYAVLTGLSPPVIRACGMAVIYLCLQIFNVRISGAQTICIANICYTALNPYILFDPGFQLSFTVTSSLLFSSQIISRYPNYLIQSFLISFICTICSLPIMLFHFFEISSAGILVNMVFVPLYSFIILPLAILSFSVLIIHAPAAEILINFFHLILQFLYGILDQLTEVPFSSIVFGKPPFIVLIMLTGFILGVFYYWEAKMLKNAKVLGLLIGMLLCYQYFAEYITPFGEVTFLDVGQGDSIFIQLPFGRGTYLIDTGGQLEFNQEKWEMKSSTFEVGEDIVTPFLKGKGITRLDKLILTHPDMDHIGGAANVLKDIEADQIMISQAVIKEYLEKEVFTNVKNSIVVPVRQGHYWTTGEERFVILNPQKTSKDSNEASIVLLAQIADKKWLFMGDLGEEGEARIAKKYPALRADFLKAGHHGSKNSTSDLFVGQIKPKYAIISAGRSNRYGHPNQEALDVLEAHNVFIYRTDKAGAVSFRFSKREGTFSQMLP
ncbi:competence protein ComEC [Peribacillus deserti]|uniref:Competence protein ComEC n=1 Tax=Peribacillus deserti TaxID=673318 RepID=A0ABS2QFA0_9BACI|nr:DNA internalization-related competence protein ComEC/Rec2 [Peribacillus deserti]MBM7691831.1 competence protein ComEC [Peribacillus deserti]